MTNSIARITLPNGQTYDLEDSGARDLIQNLKEIHNSAIHYIGVTTTNLVDGSHVNPIMINNQQINAKNGDLVLVGVEGANQNAPKEFIFKADNPNNPDSLAGTWNEFGSTGSLKNLAFKESVSASYTPTGSIIVENDNFLGKVGTITSSYTPSGTISQPVLMGEEDSISVKGTLEGSVSIPYRPRGTISTPIFEGTPATISFSYTPSGEVATPAIEVEMNTGSVVGVSREGTLPSLTMTVTDQVLNFSFSQGSLPMLETKTFATSVRTAQSYWNEDPFSGNTVSINVPYTPSGTVGRREGELLYPELTFEGTDATLTATVTSPENTFNGTFVPNGVIGHYEGDQFIPGLTFSGKQGVATGSYTPSGSITGLRFSGNSATIVSS